MSNLVASCKLDMQSLHQKLKLTADSGKRLQLRRTYRRRRTLKKTKTAGKGTGNHPGKYVIFDGETVSMQPHHSAV